jgi:hypothetical protein
MSQTSIVPHERPKVRWQSVYHMIFWYGLAVALSQVQVSSKYIGEYQLVGGLLARCLSPMNQ